VNKGELVLEPIAVFHQSSFKLIQGLEPTIDEWFVSELPKMFGRLEFRRVGGKKRKAEIGWC